MIEVAGDKGVGENRFRLFLNLAGVITTRDVGEDQLLHIGALGKLGRLRSSEMPESSRHFIVLIQIRRFHNKGVGTLHDVGETTRPGEVSDKGQACAGLGRSQNLVGFNHSAIRQA